MKFAFQKNHPFEKRLEESTKIREKYPDRIPVIVENSEKSNIPQLDKNKFLIPSELTIGQFMHVIRKRIKLAPEQAMFLFVNDKIPSCSELVSFIFEKEKDNDGFLYVVITGESTFGGKPDLEEDLDFVDDEPVYIHEEESEEEEEEITIVEDIL